MPKILCANPSCGREVYPSLPYDESYIYDGKKWYHTECCKFPKKKIDKLVDKTQQYLEVDYNREQLLTYLKQEYNLSTISDVFLKRLDNVENGTDKDLKEKVSSVKLLAMFKYYYVELSKAREYRRSSNIEEMSITGYGEPCLRHDFKVILSKLYEYNIKVASDEANAVLNSRVSTLESPDMTPYLKEKHNESNYGDYLFQKALDSYMDDEDDI